MFFLLIKKEKGSETDASTFSALYSAAQKGRLVFQSSDSPLRGHEINRMGREINGSGYEKN